MVHKILIVDDDDEDIELFCEAIGEINANITCITACNGLDAINLLLKMETRLPDYIFMDMNMPKMNGKQCIKEIKRHDHLKDIPVIMYSTSKQTADVEESIKLGAANFWTKPNNFTMLKQKLTGLFD